MSGNHKYDLICKLMRDPNLDADYVNKKLNYTREVIENYTEYDYLAKKCILPLSLNSYKSLIHTTNLKHIKTNKYYEISNKYDIYQFKKIHREKNTSLSKISINDIIKKKIPFSKSKIILYTNILDLLNNILNIESTWLTSIIFEYLTPMPYAIFDLHIPNINCCEKDLISPHYYFSIYDFPFKFPKIILPKLLMYNNGDINYRMITSKNTRLFLEEKICMLNTNLYKDLLDMYSEKINLSFCKSTILHGYLKLYKCDNCNKLDFIKSNKSCCVII